MGSKCEKLINSGSFFIIFTASVLERETPCQKEEA
jgi:hypothetical protein